MDRRNFLRALSAFAALKAVGPASAKTAINYWHHFTSEAEFAGLQKVMALFAEAFPSVGLRAENIPNSSYMPKVSAAYLANALPDSLMVTADRFADLQAMNALADITGLVQDSPGHMDLPEDRWTGFSRDGHIYAVPAFAFVDWMYYRKDYFEAAGLSGPPRTFDELLSAGRKLTDRSKGVYGFGMRGGAGGYKYVIDVMQAFGSPIVRDGQPAIDRAAAIAAIDFYSGLLLKEQIVPPSAAGDSYSQTMSAFRTGRTAMVWHHTGSLKEVSLSLRPGEQFATATIPAGPSDHIARVAYAGNAITSKGDVKNTWKWISFWGGKDASVALLEATGYFPASLSALKDPRIAQNSIYSGAIETMSIGKLPNDFVGAAAWSQNVVDPAFQSVLIGQATPAEAVDRIMSGLEKHFR